MIDLHTLTIDELRNLNEAVVGEIRHRSAQMKYAFQVGADVCFTRSTTGETVTGKLIKVNRTRAHVQTVGLFGEKRIYTVPFGMLKKLDKCPDSVV